MVVLYKIYVGEAALGLSSVGWSHARKATRKLTSPSSRSILKPRLLILSCGELGKQTMQLVNEYTASRKYVASDPILTLAVEGITVVCGAGGVRCDAVRRTRGQLSTLNVTREKEVLRPGCVATVFWRGEYKGVVSCQTQCAAVSRRTWQCGSSE